MLFTFLGRRGILGLFILTFAFAGGGGGPFIFDIERICRRIVSGSGIPGVGVAPGRLVILAFAGSGIPGVGVVPLGTALTAFAGGMPGVLFVDGARGVAENPGGNELAFTSDAAAILLLTLPVSGACKPHAAAKTVTAVRGISLVFNTRSIFIFLI